MRLFASSETGEATAECGVLRSFQFERVKPQLKRNKTPPADLLPAAVSHCLRSTRSPDQLPLLTIAYHR